MGKMIMERRYRLHSYETDTHGNMSIPALFNYLQDIASSHAASLHFGKEDLEKSDMFWVLSRIYAEMDYMPEWDSEVVITTWPRGIDGIFALRDYEISDANGVRIGGASSAWIMLDSNTRRPRRPDELLALIGTDMPDIISVGRNPQKVPPIVSEEYRSQPFQVKYSDLDVNMHVNNVKYIQWATDAYPLEFRTKNRMKSVEVNYISESFPGDEISIAIFQEAEGIFLHSLRRDSDGRELCRLRVEWSGKLAK